MDMKLWKAMADVEAHLPLIENNTLTVLHENSTTINSIPSTRTTSVPENFHQIIIQNPHHTSPQPQKRHPSIPSTQSLKILPVTLKIPHTTDGQQHVRASLSS